MAKRGHELALGVEIAFGYATLGQIGFDWRFDYGAIGTVVNLTLRLCVEAKNRQILVSQRVCASLGEQLKVEPVGELSLKGMRKPVPAYNVVSGNGSA